KYCITRDSDLSQQNNENVKETQNISAKKNRFDKKFVRIIIKDNQPIRIRNDEGFREFVEELDPLYELSSDKKVRELLVKSYNFCKEEIVHLFEQDINFCEWHNSSKGEDDRELERDIIDYLLPKP
ncbi:13560_t:CDS:2, partial [Funneliformis caledonium]